MATELKQTYPGETSFQRCVLALASQDPTFLACYRDCVNPTYFEDPATRFLAGVILEFHDQYGQPPAREALSQAVTVALQRKKRPELGPAAHELAAALYSMQVPDANYVRDRALQFARRQGLKAAVVRAIDVLRQDGDPGEAAEMFDRVLALGVRREPGSDLFEALPLLPKKWQELTSRRGVISSCFLPSLDAELYGGPRRGELYVLQGLPKAGKSFLLVNVGAWALYQGFRVLHITIGDLKEFDVELRYGSRMTGVPMKEILWNRPDYMFRLRQTNLRQNQIRIRYFSPYTLNCAQLRAYMSWLRSALGFQPDLLILDYPDKMLFDRTNTYSELGRIYMEIKGILDDFNCVGWVASQSNRLAASSRQNAVSFMAESWDKAANADGVMPISQTPDERRDNMLRVTVEMLRFGEDHFTISCRYDFSRSIIHERERVQAIPMSSQDQRLNQAAAMAAG